MNRRTFLGAMSATALTAQSFTETKPSPQQVAWQDLELGVMIHFGPNTFLDREWGDGTADPSIFDPKQFDADQWMEASQGAGARYVIMVAKHHDGFCLWPTRHTSYSVKSSPFQRDVVGEVERAARKRGLKFGLYLSPWDRHEPTYRDNKAYDSYYTRQLTELVTNYGELVEFWLDGAGSEGHVYDFDRYVDVLRTYQPNTMLFADVAFLKYGDIRWVGNEAGVAPVDNWNVIDRRGYLRYRPAEADTPLRDGHWFWHSKSESRLKPLDRLIDTYHNTVGRGAQLVLGIAPDNRGLLPDNDVARLKEFGSSLARAYANPLGTGGPNIEFNRAVTINRAVTMESLYEGQHIHGYVIEVRNDATGWREVVRGTTIGHKRIDAFPKVTAQQVRLRISASTGTPRIRDFRVFEA